MKIVAGRLYLMQNNHLYYIDYDHYYNCRPNEEDLQTKDNLIEIRCHFPKTIKKGKYIKSALGPVTYDAIKEYEALRILKKPLIPCATSGYWEGTPFLLITTEDFIITKEDEIFIQDYIHGRITNKKEGTKQNEK